MNQNDNANGNISGDSAPKPGWRKKLNRYPGRFLLFYIGVALVCIACWDMTRLVDMRRHGILAQGLVVDIVPKQNFMSSNRAAMQVPVVRFIDSQGVRHKFVECCSEQPVPMGTRFFEKGDAVEVIYLASDPDHTAKVFIGPWDIVVDGVMFAAGIVLLSQWVYLLKSPFKRLRHRRPSDLK